MIKWNEGLNLGIKPIDDDHKQILEIINELTLAISNEEEQEVMEGIFQKLQNYIQKHFHKEEALLKDVESSKLKEHIKQHQDFAKKIPELKEKFSSKDNQLDAQEVSFYLTDWLFNHIIEEDAQVIDHLKKENIQKKKKEKKDIFFIKKIIKKTTDTFSFTKRLFLLAMIPLIGMLILGLLLFWNNYTQYKDIKETSNITHIIPDINLLAHGLQIERGLSSGYLSSSQKKFKKELKEQRNIVDTYIQLFYNKSKTIESDKIKSIKPLLKTFNKDIKTINHFRNDIDKGNISKQKAINYYTKIIKTILGITSKMSMLNLNKDVSASIATLSSLLHYKEALGLKRAYGTSVIEEKNSTAYEFLKFMQLLGTQETLLNNFINSATQNQTDRLNSIVNSSLNTKIKDYEKSLQYQKFTEVDSTQWFNSMTELINNIKLFELQLLYEVDSLIEDELKDSTYILIIWLIYTILIFIITLMFIYIFEQSSKNEIFRLIEAMKHLAHGGRTLKLDINCKKDEMAQIYEAYEITRRKLLKGDMYAQLYINKKELELKAHQKQNTKLQEIAFTDSLTTLINRRKFEELSSAELQRALRYGRKLSFLMIDIDYFKSINDTYGHSIGDKVLKHFAQFCLKMIRNIDVAARVGGEEFIIMLPETDSDNAYVFAERLREGIFNSIVQIKHQEINYTISIGIAKLEEDVDTNVKTILHKADKALYKAKKDGRNRTEIYASK